MRRRKLRRSFREFVRAAWPVLEPGIDTSSSWNWHLDALCDHAQWLIDGWCIRTNAIAFRENGKPVHATKFITIDSPAHVLQGPAYVQNLLVNAAPATLKSKIFMVFLPAWVWAARCETWSVACLSGNPQNVTRDSDQCRELVQSEWYREAFAIEWELRPDVAAIGRWKITAGGERVSRGLGASGVGLHVDALFLDDPDSWDRVHSENAREEVRRQWEAYGNRVNSLTDSIRVVIQQRMHVDDLSSYLVRQGWQQLSIAVQFDPRDACSTVWGWKDPRTEPGENMHGARFTPDVCAAEKLRIGPSGFEAQYNQRPENLEGGMFKRAWLRFWRNEGTADIASMPARPLGCQPRDVLPAIPLPSKFDKVVISVDGTFGSKKEDASRVGLLVVGVRGPDKFVLADRTRKMGFVETCDAIIGLINTYPAVSLILVELKATGAAVIEQLQALMRENKLRTVAVTPCDTKGDSKESRAAAMEADVFAGHLLVEDGATWTYRGIEDDDPGFVSEVFTFPGGKNDDRVDALSQLFKHFHMSHSFARTLMLTQPRKR